MLTVARLQVKIFIFPHFQTCLLVRMCRYIKYKIYTCYIINKALSLFRGKHKEGSTWAGVFVVTGEGDSLTLGSLGDAADPCDSWLAGWSGDKASLLSSSNEKSP